MVSQTESTSSSNKHNSCHRAGTGAAVTPSFTKKSICVLSPKSKVCFSRSLQPHPRLRVLPVRNPPKTRTVGSHANNASVNGRLSDVSRSSPHGPPIHTGCNSLRLAPADTHPVFKITDKRQTERMISPSRSHQNICRKTENNTVAASDAGIARRIETTRPHQHRIARLLQSQRNNQSSATDQDENQHPVYSSLLHGDICVYESVRGSGNDGNGGQADDYVNVTSQIQLKGVGKRRNRDDPGERSDYYNVNPDSATGP
ncbi:uncharacterized protein AKAME5_002372400 [Lates japonicus]|uniref:Uncharacterized protein n=1 Tax=Lates japonicus TaxID=270547 RepID=A0AAD3NI08_LATJO|nr:uncharacterized protein AKAME5_002372400 [Lates japonicus]